MKKLLLILLLMCSLTAFTQKQQFVRDYSTSITISTEGVKGNWTDFETRIFFNYGNQNNKVKIYLGDTSYLLTQVGSTTKNKTDGGFSYTQLILEDHLGESVSMQIFDDVQFGVRFIFRDYSIIQITN